MRCTSFGLQVSFVNILKFPLIPLSFKTFSFRVNSLTIHTSTRSFFLRLLHRVFKERHDSCSTQQRHYCLHQTAYPPEKQCRCVTLTTNFNKVVDGCTKSKFSGVYSRKVGMVRDKWSTSYINDRISHPVLLQCEKSNG